MPSASRCRRSRPIRALPVSILHILEYLIPVSRATADWVLPAALRASPIRLLSAQLNASSSAVQSVSSSKMRLQCAEGTDQNPGRSFLAATMLGCPLLHGLLEPDDLPQA